MPAPRFSNTLAKLEANGLLVRVDRPINKDTELHPLVRWQFLGGIPAEERRAFLFTNVVDSQRAALRHAGGGGGARGVGEDLCDGDGKSGGGNRRRVDARDREPDCAECGEIAARARKW